MARGGKRMGAGRKKTNDPTIVMRVPMSKKDLIKQWLSEGYLSLKQDGKTEKHSSIDETLRILENALSLKANAGGKIKTEIRTAMMILQDHG